MTEWQISNLFDNENFCVNHAPTGSADGFEIVRKDSMALAYLHGQAAVVFKGHIDRWTVKTPAEEEVEEILDGLSIFGALPLTTH